VSGKLVKSYAWDLAGRLGSQLAGAVIGIILARLLSPSEFGLIGMAMVFIGISGIFTNLGLSSALVQRKDPSEEHYSSSFYLNVAASLVLTVLFILLAPAIARFFKDEALTDIVRVLSVSLLISGFTVVQEARLRKQMRFDLLTKARIISSVASGAVGVAMAFTGFGVWSLVAQTLLGRAITTVYYWFVSDWKPKLLFRLRALKELWSYSMNLFFSSMIDTAYGQLDSLIIAKLFSARELGLFSKARALNGFVIKYSSESIGSVTFPAMAEVKDDRYRMLNLGFNAERLIAFVALGLLGWLFVAAGPLILTLYGPKWEPAIEIFRLLCLSGFAYPISAATLSMLKASGDSRSFLKVEVWKKIIGLAGLAIGFAFGLKGYLVSLVMTGAIAVLLNMYFTGRSLNISLGHQLLPLLPYFGLAIASAFLVDIIPSIFKLNFVNLIFVTLLFFILYFGSNHFLRTKGIELFFRQAVNLISQLKMRFGTYKNHDE
jgi:O-antigen/teichoic acid export membrane protein